MNDVLYNNNIKLYSIEIVLYTENSKYISSRHASIAI